MFVNGTRNKSMKIQASFAKGFDYNENVNMEINPSNYQFVVKY